MTLVRRKSNSNLSNLFFDDFFGRELANLSNRQAEKQPAVNIKETEDAYKIELSAPGFEKEDFKVELNENILNISAEKTVNEEETDKKETFLRKEFSYTGFKRSFTLDEKNVETSKIVGKYEKGLLYLHIPKIGEKEKEAKFIKINIA